MVNWAQVEDNAWGTGKGAVFLLCGSAVGSKVVKWGLQGYGERLVHRYDPASFTMITLFVGVILDAMFGVAGWEDCMARTLTAHSLSLVSMLAMMKGVHLGNRLAKISAAALAAYCASLFIILGGYLIYDGVKGMVQGLRAPSVEIV